MWYLTKKYDNKKTVICRDKGATRNKFEREVKLVEGKEIIPEDAVSFNTEYEANLYKGATFIVFFYPEQIN